MTLAQERSFLAELAEELDTERPRVVLDCSAIDAIDDRTIHLLLRCLEEGMKRNGDVKLAALPPAAAAVLHEAGLSQLFELHSTPAAAVRSFHSFLPTESATFTWELDPRAVPAESAA